MKNFLNSKKVCSRKFMAGKDTLRSVFFLYFSVFSVVLPLRANPGTPKLHGTSSSLSASAVQAATERFEPSKKSWDFGTKLVKKMTVDEKIGQLVHIGINARFANHQSPFYKDLQRHIVENKLGGIIFF